MHAIELKEENVEMVKLLLDAGAVVNLESEVCAIACMQGEYESLVLGSAECLESIGSSLRQRLLQHCQTAG